MANENVMVPISGSIIRPTFINSLVNILKFIILKFIINYINSLVNIFKFLDRKADLEREIIM